MRTRYELIIYWSNDDDSFVVEVPELPTSHWSPITDHVLGATVRSPNRAPRPVAERHSISGSAASRSDNLLRQTRSGG